MSFSTRESITEYVGGITGLAEAQCADLPSPRCWGRGQGEWRFFTAGPITPHPCPSPPTAGRGNGTHCKSGDALEYAATSFRSVTFAICLISGTVLAGEKNVRLPEANLKEPVIWGSRCEEPGEQGLAFGGQDQKADDGRAHTAVRTGGVWQSIASELRAANLLQPFHDRTVSIRKQQKDAIAVTRRIYFDGLPAADEERRVQSELTPLLNEIQREIGALLDEQPQLKDLPEYETGQRAIFQRALSSIAGKISKIAGDTGKSVSVESLKTLAQIQIEIEQAAETLDAEPPARALSPLAYDPQSKLYILFGGDHCDYLTNDTWVFDPAKKRWLQRHPAFAPPPRANHQLMAGGDGRIVLSGGYTYTSNTDYCGGQYKNLNDGDWVYQAAGNTWSGGAQGEPPGSRVYRTGPFHPDFFLSGPHPDAAPIETRLKDLPVNTWVACNPPLLPRLDRCWGASIFDADRDEILVWAGGHSSHGGTDVLHYKLSTNRWVLNYPVEFPLGQLYSNTSYPSGFNFNLRPWITGHTYQNYGYDPLLKKMLFTGQPDYYYAYDPDAADWTSRAPKPAGMNYNSCFYSLTLAATPQGLVCWTEQGLLFRFNAATQAWLELKLNGKLPGSAVDYSTAIYDSDRDRLCFFRTDYGKTYDGEVYAVDLKSASVRALSPAGMKAGASFNFAIDHACYVPGANLVLMATVLSSDEHKIERTPAYDCAGNRWVSVKIGFDAAPGKKDIFPRGPRRCCSVLYDPLRKLIWGVDAFHALVYVMKFNAAEAGMIELR